jgi:two-component sensor histidine kinase
VGDRTGKKGINLGPFSLAGRLRGLEDVSDMAGGLDDMREGETQRLLDENEQLRASLASCRVENARIVADQDRLFRRIPTLAGEMQANAAPPAARGRSGQSGTESLPEQSQVEAELRVAFEELRVLTDELAIVSTALQQANDDLTAGLEARTRELAASNAALRCTELRLDTLLQGLPQLVWRSADGGDWTWSSAQWREFTGQTDETSRHLGWLDAFHEDDRPAALDAWANASVRDGVSFDGRILNAAERRYVHFATRARPTRAPGGQVVEWLGTCTDIDTIVQLQEHQTVLVSELQHRTRNLMTVVQAVMMRTIKGTSTLDEFRRRIDARMGALARVQGLLSRRGGHRVTFDTLLRAELSAHVDLADGRSDAPVSLAGPVDVPLESSLVQTFALALHELAANALKYGALSTPSGHLRVEWELRTTDAGKHRLYVDWRESGVTDLPRTDAPSRAGGYGRELIERALPYQLGAVTTYGFASDGVHCTVEVDVPPDRISRETNDDRTTA